MKTGNKKPESDFQSKAIKHIEQQGGYVVKVHVSSFQSQGTSDLLVCYMGRFIAFELKVDKNKASDLQIFKQKQVRKAGGIAKTVYTLKEIEETLYEIFRIQQGDKPD